MHAAAERLPIPSFRTISLEYPPPDTAEALEPAHVMEIAARMLHARSDAARDHLLAATMTHAADRAGCELSAQFGSALGGLLKSIAQQGSLGSDLSGLTPRQQAFQATAQFVRLAGEATRHAAEAELIAPPPLAARAALASAAELCAPALLSRPDSEIGPFEYDPVMEYFLGGLVRSVGRTVGSVARVVSKAADTVGRIRILGDVARAGIGAARLSLGPAAIAIDAGSRLARGQSLGAALKGAVTGQINAVRDQLKLAEMVAPFVPGVGAGVAAALGAANALAAGRPITDAALAAARSAVPGGAIAQAAFDTAVNLAKGKNIGEALLTAARDRLPGGPAARAAFDAAMALAQGKRLQDAAFAAAGRLLPPSPYAADALSFVRGVANGQNVQNAALSVMGQRALRQINGQENLARFAGPAASLVQAPVRRAIAMRGDHINRAAMAIGRSSPPFRPRRK